jgi:hypothetical protein
VFVSKVLESIRVYNVLEIYGKLIFILQQFNLQCYFQERIRFVRTACTRYYLNNNWIFLSDLLPHKILRTYICGASVSPFSEVRMTAMFVLLMLGN